MDHLLYSAEDFVRDESYLRYYFRLNSDDITYWQDWISRHPEKLDVIVSADQLIALLSLHLPEDEFQVEYERILKAVGSPAAQPFDPGFGERKKTIPFIPVFKRLSTLRWVAASVIVLLCIPAYFVFIARPHTPIPSSVALGMEQKINASDHSMEIELEEGTCITLEPGARLIFPHHFLQDKREVSLEGDAFFNVSKNPKRPFYIYCNNLVTHVLGTSFSIKTDKQHKKVEVSVRTGKVEVYERSSGPIVVNQQRKGNGVILTPNQKVIYKEDQQQFETTLADIPLPISDDGPDNTPDSATKSINDLVYQAIPLSSLIQSFKKTYGIEIEVENENLNNCHFSGDISDMDLYAKIDVICKSINASYEIKGFRILIRGAGCDPVKK
jgi:hypothetical protein